MALVVVFQQLFGYHVEGLCYSASKLPRGSSASLFHEESRAQIEQQRGRNVAALLIDICGIERLGICRRTGGNVSRGARGEVGPGTRGSRRCGRGGSLRSGWSALATAAGLAGASGCLVGTSGILVGAAGGLVGAGERAGRDDGRLRDGQLAAVIELEYQPAGRDRQDSRLLHPALRALQRDFVLRACPQVKTRGHDPLRRRVAPQRRPIVSWSLCAALTLPPGPRGVPCLTGWPARGRGRPCVGFDDDAAARLGVPGVRSAG